MSERAPLAVVGELASPRALREALAALRRRGWRRLDAYTPYPVRGVEELIEAPRSRVPAATLAGAVLGGAGAFLVQWYATADYPLDVGARPLFSWPAWLIITFEVAVLCGAAAAFVAMLLAARLPSLWDPLFEVEGFERASIDRFWVAVARDGGALDARRAGVDLETLGATRIAILDEDGATPLREVSS